MKMEQIKKPLTSDRSQGTSYMLKGWIKSQLFNILKTVHKITIEILRFPLHELKYISYMLNPAIDSVKSKENQLRSERFRIDFEKISIYRLER